MVLLFVLLVGTMAVVLGAAASYWLDLPTGAAIGFVGRDGINRVPKGLSGPPSRG